MNRTLFLFAILSLIGLRSVSATETENLSFRILPAPGKVTVDGKADDWDLSGGIFACGDVESASRKYAVWFHAMHDENNFYLLARWQDPTPMNHAGSSKGDYGFNGDCLQVRVVTAPNVAAPEVQNGGPDKKDAAQVRTSHLTCWRDRDGLDVIDLAYGRNFSEGGFKDAQTEGARQEFLVAADGKGYTQEIAIPWKLLAKPGVEIKPGSRILLTIEPNFTVGTGGRLTIKDLFKPGVAIDRVFTFQGNNCWGFATLEAKGNVAPQPVRLADSREFPVRLEQGVPLVDWTGLAKDRMPQGFKTIAVTMPEDGYVSLNLFGPDGSVVRQLLTSHYLPKGEHKIQWDGLTTMSVRRPGEPVPAGTYRWAGFYHTGIGLKLRGWAANSGSAPWNGWGADHGNPLACAAFGDRVYCGWGAGEGDKPLVCCDLAGNVQWKNIRGGIAGASLVATDGKNAYAFNPVGGYAAKAVYRVDARTGRYTEWKSLKNTDLTMKDIWGDAKEIPEQPTSLAAAGGKVFVSFDRKNTVAVVDAETGAIVKKIEVPGVGPLAAASAKQLFAVAKDRLVEIDVEAGQTKDWLKPQLAEGTWVSALATDAKGNAYAAVRGTQHHVLMFGPDAKLIRRIGREKGRPLIGPWQADGMFNPAGIAVDSAGKLWVAEDDDNPRRVSVWDTATGQFEKELFGASSYGATGAIVNPEDPNLLVGQGCEWRNDPQTGRSVCLGTITRDGMGASRFGYGPGGKLYLAITPTFLHGPGDIRIFERLGDANYKLRTMIRKLDKEEGGKKKQVIEVWSDENNDAERQPAEVQTYDKDLGGWLNGWYMPMTPDLTFYGSLYQVKVTGWTACGAPKFDFAAAAKLPAPDDVRTRGGMGAQKGHGSVDGKYILWNAPYGEDHGTVDCYEIASGKKVFSYPSNFTGVHGSHRAGPPEVGMIRGAYDITGAAKLPDPIGNVWVIPTNKGEWHVVTERGFYLTRLFQGDLTRVQYPEQAVPGVSLDSCPPGSGEEAFGGSITQTKDGGLTVQAGHISYWNCEVTGLDTVKALPGGEIAIASGDPQTAATFRERYLQEASGVKKLVAKKAAPVFTGDLAKDFASSEIVKFAKSDATAVRVALAWDERFLYAAWEVKDPTPWINGADAPEFLYARGDTVDLQLGIDPKAAANRSQPVLGDLRLSIGNFQGKPTAVVYRKVAKEKAPKFFNSGTVKNYEMESVVVLAEAKVEVKLDPVRKLYTVEAAIPLEALGFTPKPGLVLRGDLGATHSDQVGRDTLQRTHWSNQATGLVSDEVGELQMTPSAWGEIRFE